MIKHDPTNARHRSWPILAPQDLEIAGLNFIQFSSSCSVFRIKVDSRPFPEEGLATVVGGGPNLAVLQRAYSPSPYFSLAKKPWPKPPLHRKDFPEMMSMGGQPQPANPGPHKSRYQEITLISPSNQIPFRVMQSATVKCQLSC